MLVRLTYTETTHHDVTLSVDADEVRGYLAGLTGTGLLPDNYAITPADLRSFIDAEGVPASPVTSAGETRSERVIGVVTVTHATGS